MLRYRHEYGFYEIKVTQVSKDMYFFPVHSNIWEQKIVGRNLDLTRIGSLPDAGDKGRQWQGI